MKYLFVLFTAFSTLFAACSKDNFSSHLEDSGDAWLKFKKANNNTYSYTVVSSSWVGTSSYTTIRVKNGVVVGRSYEGYIQDQANGQRKLVKSWSEDNATLSTNAEGAQPQTLDDVYDKARNEWLKADKKENDIIFETANNGMISSCGYIPKNCADDCFRGITISEIKPWPGN